jgi:hypothetical protein
MKRGTGRRKGRKGQEKMETRSDRNWKKKRTLKDRKRWKHRQVYSSDRSWKKKRT